MIHSQFQILLDLADIAENIRDLVLKADDVALSEDYLDIFLVELLKGADDLVQRSDLVVYWLL